MTTQNLVNIGSGTKPLPESMSTYHFSYVINGGLCGIHLSPILHIFMLKVLICKMGFKNTFIL